MAESLHHAGLRPREGPVVNPGRIDAAIVQALFIEHGAEVRRFVLGVVRAPELADDIMQAAFAKAVESGHMARTETLKGWLFRIAYHEALAVKRRAGVGEQALRRLACRPQEAGQEPCEPLIRAETASAVQQALGALPDEQRRVVRARIYEDKTFAAIADELGLPLGTVLTRMRLALEKLRRALPQGD